jgi:hypothetical protein
MKKSLWIAGSLVLFALGLVIGLYLGASYAPNHIVLQAQSNTKVNLKPQVGDVLEWQANGGGALPVEFSQGSEFFPCDEAPKKGGNSTCTLKKPPQTMSFTYTCAGCFDPTLGPVSGTTPGGNSLRTLLGSFVRHEAPDRDQERVAATGGGMAPNEVAPALSSGLPIEASVSCDAENNVIVFQNGSLVKTITVNPTNLLQLTGFTDSKPNPVNPVSATGQPLCTQGDLNPKDACTIGSAGSYALAISASECTGAAWAGSVTVTP